VVVKVFVESRRKQVQGGKLSRIKKQERAGWLAGKNYINKD
jgi:hypothetical protein